MILTIKIKGRICNLKLETFWSMLRVELRHVAFGRYKVKRQRRNLCKCNAENRDLSFVRHRISSSLQTLSILLQKLQPFA